MNGLPSDDEIVALHKKYAPSQAAFDFVFTHCRIVWELAEELIRKSNLSVNSELVKAACLLHDIGVYKLYLSDGKIDHANYIKHGIEGYTLLKEEGFNERLSRLASCHTGVGLTKREIKEQALPIPLADYMAETLEEQLIMHADKFHSKEISPKSITVDTYAKRQRKFGEEKTKRFRQLQKQFGTPELREIANKYGAEII